MSKWDIPPATKNVEITNNQEEVPVLVEGAIEKEQPEHIHTKEEAFVLFEKILGEAKFEDIRILEDEQGLYLWEIRIPQEDGGSTEYSYIRKGDYKERGLAGGSSPDTQINVVYFDAEGDYIHGTSVTKFLQGAWKDTPADAAWLALIESLKKGE